MASFLSMDMTDTSLTPENLQVKAQLLAQDIRERIQKEQNYIDWLNRYRGARAQGASRSFGIGNRPPLRPLWPGEHFVCLSSADAETEAIIHGYHSHRQELSLWGRFVAYISGDDACYAELQSLVALDRALTQVSEQLRMAHISPAPTDAGANLPPISSVSLATTTITSSVTTPERALPLPGQLKQVLDNALQQAISHLPWRHKLLSPLRSLQTFWQSFTTTPSQALSSAGSTMFREPFVSTFGGHPTQPRTYRTGRHARYTGPLQPAASMPTTISSGEFDVSSSSSSSPSPAIPLALFDGIAEALDQTLKGLVIYGNQARHTDGRSFSQALQDLRQPTSASSEPNPLISLDELWQQHINSLEQPNGRRSGLYSLSWEAYRWFGLNPYRTDCRLTWHRLLLHYGRLQQGIQALRNALDAEALDEGVITRASSYLANVLWEGAVLSHQQSATLFKHHFQLICKLRALCLSHDSHPALAELISTLDNLPREVKITVKQAPGRRNKHSLVYQVTLEPDEASADWRLQHQSRINSLHCRYEKQNYGIRALIRYIEVPEASAAATEALRALCVSLDGPLRSAMLTAITEAEARSSREAYTRAVGALESLLTELRRAHPLALYKVTLSLSHAAETPVEKGIRGFMAIKPELFPLINRYLVNHPDSLLAQYRPSFDEVPLDVVLKGLPKLLRLTDDESDKELQQLISWHRACAYAFQQIIECRKQATESYARAEEEVIKRQQLEEETWRERERAERGGGKSGKRVLENLQERRRIMEKAMRGFMGIKPELFPLINRYLVNHPDSLLAQYRPSFDEVPLDVVLKGLPKLLRLTDDESDKELQQLISWHRACAYAFQQVIECRKQATESYARAEETVIKQQQLEEETWRERERTEAVKIRRQRQSAEGVKQEGQGQTDVEGAGNVKLHEALSQSGLSHSPDADLSHVSSLPSSSTPVSRPSSPGTSSSSFFSSSSSPKCRSHESDLTLTLD